MFIKYTVIASILLIVSTTAAIGDIHWKQTDTIRSSSETVVVYQSVFIHGDTFALETSDGMKIIFDLSNDSITTLDMNTKTAHSTSLKKLELMRNTIRNDTKKLIEDALKNIPESQRVAYRKQLVDKMGYDPDEDVDNSSQDANIWDDFESTGKTETISGFSASHYQTVDGDDVTHEMWCSEDVDTTELDEFYRKAGNNRLLKKMRASIPTLSLGFPVKYIRKDGDGGVESIVTSVSFDAIPASVFMIPKDFTTQ